MVTLSRALVLGEQNEEEKEPKIEEKKKKKKEKEKWGRNEE